MPDPKRPLAARAVPIGFLTGKSFRRISSSLFVLFALCSSVTFASGRKTAVDSVRDFYRRYLGDGDSKLPKTPPPTIALSKAFFAELAKTKAICNKYGEGPCGWGADGDKYLDAQEIDPILNYSNSRITISENAPGAVQVKLNVYPSARDAGDAYDRTITYMMVVEHGSYVVDDVAYADGVSLRKKLLSERAYTWAHPRQDAAGNK